ncbi:transposase [Aquimarina sp. ERC-38]|nr:transposase [Aquimarina sp. ERC-38]
MESQGIKSFIPPHGTYKGGPDGFQYIETEDHYLCPKGNVIPFTKEFLDHRTKTRKKEYRASKKICAGCPLRKECLKSSQEKRITVTYYRAEYERNIARVNSKQGRYMKAKRQSTVEPVFGTLTQFMGLRKINTISIGQANKVMHLATIAYNLKKYLKFTKKNPISKVGVCLAHNFSIKMLFKTGNVVVLR